MPGAGGDVHALYARPADAPDGPLPTVFTLHGGPHSADEDRFSAYRAAWLDAGFAVVHVNYRGSTGYGSAWRDAIEGRPGLTELADVAAVHAWAVEKGLADPARCVVNGASWGGYLSLLALGTQPDAVGRGRRGRAGGRLPRRVRGRDGAAARVRPGAVRRLAGRGAATATSSARRSPTSTRCARRCW